MKKNASTTKAQPFHFYASSVYGWSTSESEADAITKAARWAGTEIMKHAVKGEVGGIEVVCFRVELPEAAHYLISDYRPTWITVDGKKTDQRVPMKFVGRFAVRTWKGDKVPMREPGEPEPEAPKPKPKSKRIAKAPPVRFPEWFNEAAR